MYLSQVFNFLYIAICYLKIKSEFGQYFSQKLYSLYNILFKSNSYVVHYYDLCFYAWYDLNPFICIKIFMQKYHRSFITIKIIQCLIRARQVVANPAGRWGKLKAQQSKFWCTWHPRLCIRAFLIYSESKYNNVVWSAACRTRVC